MKNQNTTKPYTEFGCRRQKGNPAEKAAYNCTPDKNMLQAAKRHQELFTAIKA